MPSDKNIAIRLSVKDADVVKRALNAIGKDGESALKRIDRASKPASGGLKFVNQAAIEGKSELTQYANRLGPVGSSLAAIGPGGLAAAAGIGAFTIGLSAAIRESKEAIDSFSDIANTADKIGLTTDALQELRFAGEQVGVSQKTTDLALQRFSRRVGEAAQGTGELKGILDQYDIKVRDANGNQRDLNDILSEYAEVTRNAESEQEKLRLGFKAFDSEGAALVNLLRQGADGMDRLAAEALNAGVVVDAHTLRSARETGDQLQALSTIIDINLKQAFVGLSPLLVHSSELFAQLSKKANEFFQSIQSVEFKVNFDLPVKELEQQIEKLEQQKRELDEKIAILPEVTFGSGFTLRDKLVKERDDILSIIDSTILKIDALNARKEINTRSGITEDSSGTDLEALKTITANETIIEQLNQQIDKQRLLNSGKEREAFILDQVRKIQTDVSSKSKEDVDRQIADAKHLAGILYDELQLKKENTDANQNYIQTLKEQIKVGMIMMEQDETAREIKLALSKLNQDATEDEIQQVEELTKRLIDQKEALAKLNLETEKQNQLRDEAIQLTQRHLEPLQQYQKQLDHLNLLLKTGELSTRAYAAELEAAQRELLRASEDTASGVQRGLLNLQDAVGTMADQSEFVVTELGTSIKDTLKEAFKSGEFSAKHFGEVVEDVFAEIAARKITSAISNQIAAPFFSGSPAASLFNVPFFHKGGVVGRDGTAGLVPAHVFEGAQRFHRGGIAGLRSDEVPAVLQTGERVLSRSEVNHMNNSKSVNQYITIEMKIQTPSVDAFRQDQNQIFSDMYANLQEASRLNG